MKVILVHNTYQRPGGEDIVFEQERLILEKHGASVAVYRRSNDEIKDLSAVDRLLLVKRMTWAKETERSFERFLSDTGVPDVVHVHNTFLMVSPSIYTVCRRHAIPVVQTLHNYRLLCPASTFFRDGRVCEECVDHGLTRSVCHGCYRASRPASAAVAVMLAWHRSTGTWSEMIDRYIALTEFARRKFVAAGLPAEKVVVKPNCIYPDPGPRTDAGSYAVFIGRLSPEKGVATLLEAWRQIGAPCPLKIVGDGPERPALEFQARRHDLSQVAFLGSLSRPDAAAVMRGARFFVLPSVWYEAGLPMTLLEAFASGVPVLCSRLGAMETLVEHREIGLHFPAGDPAGLAAQVDWALANPAELQAIGQRGRREFEARYTADRNYSQLMRVYEQAIESRRRAGEKQRPAAYGLRKLFHVGGFSPRGGR